MLLKHRSMRMGGLLVLALFSSLVMAIPEIQKWETKNGARVLFVLAPELPMVDVRVVFDAGSARDGSKLGLAALTNAVLAEGAGGLTAERISERFEGVGARFENGVARDMAWVSLRSITEPESLTAALANLALVLERPDFPAEAFERERKRMRVALKARQQDPDQLAEDTLYAAIYRGHPYASFPYGTEQSLMAIKRAELKSFFTHYYTARNATVAIVGDLSRAQAEALAETLVGKLPSGSRAELLPAVLSLTEPTEIRVSHPSTQTHIRLGQPGVARLDPDFFALYVGNHALGGGALVSRLSKEIRQKRGLSYSVYSYFLPMRVQGPFITGIETRNDQVEQALTILRDTLRDFIAQGPTPEELKASIKNISGGFPLRIDSNSEIVEYLAMIGFYELPLDYLKTFVQRVEAVTLEQVRDAFKRHLSPVNLATVIVGGKVLAGQHETQATAHPSSLGEHPTTR